MNLDTLLGVCIGLIWGAFIGITFLSPGKKALDRYRSTINHMTGILKQVSESNTHWVNEYIRTADLFRNLARESAEAREFWAWNRKYRRGAVTEYRNMQRAKKRLGVE